MVPGPKSEHTGSHMSAHTCLGANFFVVLKFEVELEDKFTS